MNQFNSLHVDETNEPPIKWNSHSLEFHFKSHTSPPKISPVFLDIMGRLNHHIVDNSDVEVYPLYYPVEYSFDSLPDPDTNPIKSIDDDEIDQLLELFHSKQDDDLLAVDLQMLQYLLEVDPS